MKNRISNIGIAAITLMLLLSVSTAYAQEERQMIVRWQIAEENTIGLSYEDPMIQIGDTLGFEINNQKDWVIINNSNEYSGAWFIGLNTKLAGKLKKMV